MQAEKAGKTDILPYTNFLIRQVIEELSAHIEADVASKGGAGAYKKFAQYLGSLDSKIVALRATQNALSVLFSNGAADQPQPVAKKVAHAIGRAVYLEYLMTHFAKLAPPLFNSILREHHRTMTSDERRVIKVFQARFQQEGYTYPTWPHGDVEMVGNYLMHQLKALSFIEIWNKVDRVRGKPKVQQYVTLGEDIRSSGLALMERIAEAPRLSGPLIEPPLAWDAATNTGGGYHTEDMQRMMAYAVQGSGPRQMPDSVIEGINYLQTIAWQVNVPVLEAVRAVSLTHDIGSDITGADPGPMPEFNGDTPEEKKAWKRRAHEWYTERRIRSVKHRRVQKAYREAAELAPYSSIWFAYYADFRGRVYARAGGISPQGTDLEKGLLRFATGKGFARGSTGEFWFKAHGASKYGLDKISFENRVRWVDEQHDTLLAIAADPVGVRAWTEADQPVQFLAWAMEYAAWVADPDGFESHIPISLDGTCNGLQNFSALLRDEVGGRAVNLIDGPKPNDVYADVAVKTTHRLESMPPSPLRDAWLAHGINRKVTKRTTMTLPYGCTRFACAEFIVKDYLEVEKPPEIPMADYGEAGNFLSHVVWAAIGDTVIKAREAMEWLKGWAVHAAKNGHRVEWVTPTGLLVRNEYERERAIRIKSVAFKSRITLYRPDGSLDTKRIANAIAPNFVHSLDASHLTMVLNKAQRAGMTVAAIHDDFGVHAADTEEFAGIIRREFIRMYEDSTILQRLADATGYTAPPPSPGLLDLNNIESSRYFFA